MPQSFISTAELTIPEGIPTEEAKTEMTTHQVIAEPCKI